MRTLTEALHELYGAAGRPGLRKIANAVTDGDGFRDTVSHQKVAAMLHGDGPPRWSKLEPVVRVLAELSTPRRDPDREARRFKLLWDATSALVSAEEDPEPPVARSRLSSVLILGGVTGETRFPDFERSELEQFCQKLGEGVAEAGLDLVICSPFPDSADFHALRGFVETGTSGTVHMHRPRHPVVEQHYAQLHEVLGDGAVMRITNWYYPGPETNDQDSLAQAWVFCQLMAMEHADVIVAVGGKPGNAATTILRLAEARRQPVVPFAFLGGAAERAFRRRDWNASYPWLDTTKLSDKNAAKDAMAIADRMATTRIRESDDTPRGQVNSVFISRAKQDKVYADALRNYLFTSGRSVLFDEQAVPSDQTVEAAIEDAVRGSDLFIVLWSRSYAASRYCYDEIDLALELHRAGDLELWIINLDGSQIVPKGARRLPVLQARTKDDVVAVVQDLLDDTE